MPTPAYAITCTRKRIVAPNVYELAFGKPEGFTFKAGQFVLFDIPLMADAADIQPRAYSIASTPGEPELLFGVKLKEGGRASRFIVESLSVGDVIRIQGPFGLFTVSPEADRKFVFVATGAGVAPFRSQIKWLLEECRHAGRLDLVFGVREQKDMFWVDEFSALAAAHPNFGLHLTLSGTDPAWTGLRGRVQTVLPAVISDVAATHVYICGAPDMVQDTKKLCIESLGLSKIQTHAEGYI